MIAGPPSLRPTWSRTSPGIDAHRWSCLGIAPRRRRRTSNTFVDRMPRVTDKAVIDDLRGMTVKMGVRALAAECAEPPR